MDYNYDSAQESSWGLFSVSLRVFMSLFFCGLFSGPVKPVGQPPLSLCLSALFHSPSSLPTPKSSPLCQFLQHLSESRHLNTHHSLLCLCSGVLLSLVTCFYGQTALNICICPIMVLGRGQQVEANKKAKFGITVGMGLLFTCLFHSGFRAQGNSLMTFVPGF